MGTSGQEAFDLRLRGFKGCVVRGLLILYEAEHFLWASGTQPYGIRSQNVGYGQDVFTVALEVFSNTAGSSAAPSS